VVAVKPLSQISIHLDSLTSTWLALSLRRNWMTEGPDSQNWKKCHSWDRNLVALLFVIPREADTESPFSDTQTQNFYLHHGNVAGVFCSSTKFDNSFYLINVNCMVPRCFRVWCENPAIISLWIRFSHTRPHFCCRTVRQTNSGKTLYKFV